MIDDVMYEVYNEQYIHAATQIIRKRFQFMDLLQEWAEPIHAGISQGKETLAIKYRTVAGIEKEHTPSEVENLLHKKNC